MAYSFFLVAVKTYLCLKSDKQNISLNCGQIANYLGMWQTSLLWASLRQPHSQILYTERHKSLTAAIKWFILLFFHFAATSMLFTLKVERKHRHFLFLQFCAPEELCFARGNFYQIANTVTTVSCKEPPVWTLTG